MPKLKTQHLVYFILATLLVGAFFVRVYRTSDLLRFYFDQGRDALIIRDVIHIPKPVLVGPTTGLAGILRGPAFYYLLLPAYYLSNGSPIAAAVWLQIINIVGLVFVYLTTKEIFNRWAGLLAVLLMGFNNHIVSLSRWLSNPSPILTSVPIMLYGLVQIDRKNKPQVWWPIVALMIGLNLQFEMASEIWFIPAILLLVAWRKHMRPSLKLGLLSTGIFLATLFPQLLFDLRHDHLMWKAIVNHFASSTQPSFTFSIKLIQERWNLYLDSFSLILAERSYWMALVITLITIVLLITRKLKSQIWVLLLLLVLPLLILSFYQGNEGNFYSYYLIGLFPLFLILAAGTLAWCLKHKVTIGITILVLFFFSIINYDLLHGFLNAGLDGQENIVLGNQLQAIAWIYKNADSRDFNVDVYVPPVIPYAYDYLFWWQGSFVYQKQPQEKWIKDLYTLYEVDPPHPERLRAWLERQATIGEVKEEISFGGVHVERRVRK